MVVRRKRVTTSYYEIINLTFDVLYIISGIFTHIAVALAIGMSHNNVHSYGP
jgi:hypothetical protein